MSYISNDQINQKPQNDMNIQSTDVISNKGFKHASRDVCDGAILSDSILDKLHAAQTDAEITEIINGIDNKSRKIVAIRCKAESSDPAIITHKGECCDNYLKFLGFHAGLMALSIRNYADDIKDTLRRRGRPDYFVLGDDEARIECRFYYFDEILIAVGIDNENASAELADLRILLHDSVRCSLDMNRHAQTQAHTLTELCDEIELKRLQAEKDAATDTLTGVYNRRSGIKLLKEQLRQYDGTHVSIALLIDIDNFKNINDNHGHTYGDSAIIHMMECVRKAINSKDGDFIFRLGGEEFVVFIKNIGENSPLDVADNIRASVKRHILVCQDGTTVPFTVSVGVAILKPDSTIDTLLDLADESMYQAKRRGKDRCAIHNPETQGNRESERTYWVRFDGRTSLCTHIGNGVVNSLVRAVAGKSKRITGTLQQMRATRPELTARNLRRWGKGRVTTIKTSPAPTSPRPTSGTCPTGDPTLG